MNVTVLLSITIVASFQIWREVRAMLFCLAVVATPKYVEPLLHVFGERLVCPAEFVGRGDMSRGGLLLRCVAAREELVYIPVLNATRCGPRPAKLPQLIPHRSKSRDSESGEKPTPA